MVASNALSGNALRPIGLLVQSWAPAIEARAAWGRLDQLLLKHERIDSTAEAPTLQGAVTLQDLSAGVEGRREPIIQGISAEFAPGEVIGIVGPSGAGKSTLARCLLGIWPQRGGRVLYDGVPIEQLSREAIGPQLGYLPQDIDLFDGTIAENIGRFAEVEPAEVVEAARMAGIHEMVLRLPKGYDTPIGEFGSILSGGQRQRLGLARACLGSPRIVVLDEPNANLDDAGEAALVQAVLAMKARKTTVFMIVHRPSLLAVADRILVLENGRMSRLAIVQRAVQPAAPPERQQP
jgi:ATP-binding cassette, subfamily C, bacterial exporter for protease/lipase